MTKHNDLLTFFKNYEVATRKADTVLLDKLYAESFIFCDPVNVTHIKKEDFLKAIPMRKSYFEKLGLVGSNLKDIKEVEITPQDTLVKVCWTMQLKKADKMVEFGIFASYVVRGTQELQILMQIDHQNLKEYVKEV
jgi:hypothetical protein